MNKFEQLIQDEQDVDGMLEWMENPLVNSNGITEEGSTIVKRLFRSYDRLDFLSPNQGSRYNKMVEVFFAEYNEIREEYWWLVDIDPEEWHIARDFCRACDLDNREEAEYVRGQAELICDLTPGLNITEHRDIVMRLLVQPHR